MIYKKQADVFEYEGKKYQIGATVKANEQSVYEGLIGFIVEIRTGKDKETKNPGPDIYCDFIRPHFQKELSAFQRRYGKTCDEPFDLESVNLDGVIMAPEMLGSANKNKPLYPHEKIKVYVLQEEWIVNGEGGVKIYVFFDCDEAKENYRVKIYEEKRKGIVWEWLVDYEAEIIEEIDESEYIAYIKNGYCENRYTIWLTEREVHLSGLAVARLNEKLSEWSFYKDFAKQVEPWEEVKQLTQKEYKAFVNDPSIPERILQKLSGYKMEEDDAYTNEVSEVAHELLSEYLARKQRVSPKEVKK